MSLYLRLRPNQFVAPKRLSLGGASRFFHVMHPMASCCRQPKVFDMAVTIERLTIERMRQGWIRRHEPADRRIEDARGAEDGPRPGRCAGSPWKKWPVAGWAAPAQRSFVPPRM